MKDDMLPRSRLYPLPPRGAGTPFIESLTSYINRLAWTYRINPRQLLTLEIIPSLGGTYHSPYRQLSSFVHYSAMGINGIGKISIDWTTTLELLTLRSDLRYLNIHLWASELPMRSLMRVTPAWCPQCYEYWLQNNLPIYQPLLWMLQVVTICLKHRKRLETQCPHCQKHQAVIGSSVLPIGHCTRCRTWLGVSSRVIADDGIDDDTFTWQEWVMNIIEELRGSITTSGLLPWGDLRQGLSVSRKAMGGAQKLCHITGIPANTLDSWIAGKIMPSIEGLLKFCYALDLSPLLLMTGSSSTLVETLKAKRIYKLPQSRRPAPLPKKEDHIFEFIRAALEGREAPHAIAQIGRRFGRSINYITYHFPQEAPLVAAHYRAYRSEQMIKRLEQIKVEVRTATFSLHTQGIFPSQQRVSSMLTDPNWMIMPEARAAWHAARQELGLEP